ncbi:MAG TPA: DNA polymerase III subunit delta' [Verrucomicrobiae bacterium]|nr:DNA polymerase III subunit delta' [Verrucomicrobiae bacterium]
MSFNDFQEQKGIAAQLRRSLERGRLAHAYLFAGPRGSGKESMARTLAKALNCTEKEHDSCDRCDSCRRIEEGVHPDVYWVRPESKSRRIQIEQMREFMKSVNLRSSMGGVKVGIVVDADCMGEEAGNAFLKTLEEPPAQTVIVLLTADPQRLLPTILSRCLRISFGPVTGENASPYAEKLLPLLTRFSATTEERVANSYRLLAELTALLQEIRNETRARVEGDLNLDRYAELDPKVRDRLEEQMEARIEGEYRATREQVLEEMYQWFGDLLLCVVGADTELLAHPGHVARTRELADGLMEPQACHNLEAVEQIRDSLSRNISEPLAIEVGLLKLAPKTASVAR